MSWDHLGHSLNKVFKIIILLVEHLYQLFFSSLVTSSVTCRDRETQIYQTDREIQIYQTDRETQIFQTEREKQIYQTEREKQIYQTNHHNFTWEQQVRMSISYYPMDTCLIFLVCSDNNSTGRLTLCLLL